MDNAESKLLFDILEAIRAIDTYIGTPRDFGKYERDPMLQDAGERNLEIIGEAMNRLLKINPRISISESRRIVDARNIIIHSYDSLDNPKSGRL